MKLTTLMLADHASVREGTLGVLGGYITQLWRPGFPAELGAVLVAVLSPTDEDLSARSAKVNFQFVVERDGSDAPLVEGEGNFTSDLMEGQETYFPLVFNIERVELPSEGKYTIRFNLDGDQMSSYSFYANHIPAHVEQQPA